MRLILWLLGLPWEVLVLLSIVACSFWTAVLARRLQRRSDMQRWQAFTEAMER